jgi:predicted nucleic-acid-binding protein
VIGLDTNILVRLIVEDDLEQAAAGGGLLRDAAAAGETAFLANPLLCELVWVLESRYRISQADVAAALQDLLANSLFEFEDRKVVQSALDVYRRGEADFADLLIGFTARAHGARTTYTFDRPLSRLHGFSRLAT